MLNIWSTDASILFFIAMAAFLLAIEIGFRIGSRHQASTDEILSNHVSALQNALFGLLALLLAFTFAMSITRFDTRKELVVQEANAIGTAYLRTQFLPEPYNRKIADLFKLYVDAKMEFYGAGIDKNRLDAASAKRSDIEGQLWSALVDASKHPHDAILFGLFVQALNDVIDVHEKHQTALDDHVPEAVIWLLFLVSIVGMGFVGYGDGIKNKRCHGSTAMFALLIASVLIIILDIDRPRRGFVQVSRGSMERLQMSIKQNDVPVVASR